MTNISIALATFNGSQFLNEQLSSYVSQTVLPDELIVSDDGSQDATLDIIAEFARTAPFPVRIISGEPHLGFADNFFRAARACSGRFIAFSDQDDVWRPTKLALAQRRLQQDDSWVALHTSVLTDVALAPMGVLTQGITASRVCEPLELDPYVGLGWGNTMMFDRRLLELVPPEERPRQPEAPDRPLSHDTWIYAFGAALGRVSHIEESLCLYRQHQGNAFGSRKRGLVERIGAALEAPLSRHRSRVEFYQALEAIFDRISATQQGDIAERARRAADVYRQRWQQLQTRINIYTGETFQTRMGQFIQFSRTATSDVHAPSPMLSRLKDMVIGVCGMGRIR